MTDEQENAAIAVERRRKGWHMDKRVSVSHLITTALLAVALAKWGMIIESRMGQHEMFEMAQRDRDAAQDRTIEKFDGHLTGQIERVDTKLTGRLDRIDDKLDRLIEGRKASQ
jgi:hypothetical protein